MHSSVKLQRIKRQRSIQQALKANRSEIRQRSREIWQYRLINMEPGTGCRGWASNMRTDESCGLATWKVATPSQGTQRRKTSRFGFGNVGLKRVSEHELCLGCSETSCNPCLVFRRESKGSQLQTWSEKEIYSRLGIFDWPLIAAVFIFWIILMKITIKEEDLEMQTILINSLSYHLIEKNESSQISTYKIR